MPSNQCPLCSGPMDPVEVRNALSRYVDRYICSPCGNREAVLGLPNKLHPSGRECLYYDGTGPVMRVNEKINGYQRFMDASQADDDFIRAYVIAVNERHGIGEKEANDIVAKSMFSADLTFVDER